MGTFAVLSVKLGKELGAPCPPLQEPSLWTDLSPIYTELLLGREIFLFCPWYPLLGLAKTLTHRIFKNRKPSQVLVTHAYNPSYSGGRDQEDHSSRLAQANSSLFPILKIPITKQGWWNGSSGRVPTV
jgi:hypothetical protein